MDLAEHMYIMDNSKLKGKDLNKINFTSDQAKSMAIDIMSKYFKHTDKEEKLTLLEQVFINPEAYLEHPQLSRLAKVLFESPEEPQGTSYALNALPEDYKILGSNSSLKIPSNKWTQRCAFPLPSKEH